MHDVFFILSSVGLLMFIHEAVSLEAFRFFSLCFDNRINDRFCVQRMVCLNGWSWSEKKQCDKKIDFRIPSRISRISFAVCCNWITWEQFSLHIEGKRNILPKKKKRCPLCQLTQFPNDTNVVLPFTRLILWSLRCIHCRILMSHRAIT